MLLRISVACELFAILTAASSGIAFDDLSQVCLTVIDRLPELYFVSVLIEYTNIKSEGLKFLQKYLE